MKSALSLIADERDRQIKEEGYTEAHDKEMHSDGALAIAAACYAAHPLKIYRKEELAESIRFNRMMPFSEYTIDKKHSEIRRLTIAGALIVAEIERLQNIKR